MKKLLNYLFYFLKFILLIGCFVSTLYIIVYMYQRLHKDLSESIQVFLPYVVIFVLFAINLIARQKGVNNNIFYNITCCLVFATILFCGYRAIFDKHMIMNAKLGYEINFNYYADVISPMKIMIYGLCIANLCLMFLAPKKKLGPELAPVVEEVQKKEADQAKEETELPVKKGRTRRVKDK